eukprot:scaffold197475_cov37-Prasinocladus_malaysianus.AAC.1
MKGCEAGHATSREHADYTLLIGGDMQTSPAPMPSQSIILRDIRDNYSIYVLNDPQSATFPRSGSVLDHWFVQKKTQTSPPVGNHYYHFTHTAKCHTDDSTATPRDPSTYV